MASLPYGCGGNVDRICHPLSFHSYPQAFPTEFIDLFTATPSSATSTAPDCEFFCQVVDNFGDIGVCWRLARALAARGYAVRLWVDDWATLARLCPPAAVAGDGLRMDGVELRR